jgi:hypothetical protein
MPEVQFDLVPFQPTTQPVCCKTTYSDTFTNIHLTWFSVYKIKKGQWPE